MARKNLDDFLSQFGNPGRCQLLTSLIIILCVMNWTLVQQFNVIQSYLPDHYCQLPSQNWNWSKGESIPEGSSCTIYANPANYSEGEITCPNGWEYETLVGEIYPANDFDLVCDREFLFRLSLTLPYLGVVLGGFVFGSVSDKYGRKKTCGVLLIAMCVLVIGSAFAPDLESFIVIRFVLGFVSQGVQTCCFTYVSELFRRHYRTIMSSIFGYSAAVLLAVQAYLMYFFIDWRIVQFGIGVFMVFSAIAVWFIPESVPWLLNKGNIDEAERILVKFAHCNKIEIPSTLRKDLEEQIELMNEKQQGQTSLLNRWGNLFCTSTLRYIVCSIMFIGFTNACVLNGLSFSISKLEGNMYTNYLINSGLQVVEQTIALMLFTRFGRVRILAIQIVFGGVLGAIGYALVFYSDVVGEIIGTLAVYTALIGRNLISATASMLMTYASELFPTPLRSTGLGLAFMSCRMGSAVSPQILYTLNHIWEPLPQTIYGVMCIIAAFVLCFLPETFSRAMPNTIEDVEELMHADTKPPVKNAVIDEKTPLLQGKSGDFLGSVVLTPSNNKKKSSVADILIDVSKVEENAKDTRIAL